MTIFTLLIGSIVTSVFMWYERLQVTQQPEISRTLLPKGKKAIVWILCIINPVIAGTVLFYGWRKPLPNRAKQANTISLWAFGIVFLLGVFHFFLFASTV